MSIGKSTTTLEKIGLLCLVLAAAFGPAPASAQELAPAPTQESTPEGVPAEAQPLAVADAGAMDCGKEAPFDIFSSLKGAKHPSVEGDYLVLIYDARNHVTSWYDYKQKDGRVKITRNASFIPVVYSREKFAVHVCGLRFTDALTVTTNPIGVPEGGADIRGITAATTPAPALAGTVDLFTGSQNTGASVQPGNLGFGATAPLSVLAVAGFASGVVSLNTAGNKALYQDASIAISPEQLALMMTAFAKNAESVKPGIVQIIAGTPDSEGEPDKPENRFAFAGTVNNVQNIADNLLYELVHKGNPALRKNRHPDEFNSYIYRVQSLVGQLAGLNGTVSSAALGSRAVTLRQNYATIRGVLDLVRNVIDTDEYLPADKDCPASLDELSAKTKFLVDTPTCRFFELQTFRRFLSDYCRSLEVDECLAYGQAQEHALFADIRTLHDGLQHLDETVAKIFAIMNKWYELSNVEETDLLTPSTSNALERINIIVQRTFVPFTFAASSQPAAVAQIPATPAAGGGGAGGSGSATTPSSTAPTAESVLVEVHRRANFNLVGGVMAIRVPTKSFGLQPQTAQLAGLGTATSPYTYSASCNGGATTSLSVTPSSSGQPQSAPYYCATVTQTSNWQIAAMTGIAWFPMARDYFPHGSGATFHVKNLAPSILVASSVTSLGSVFVGPNFEPVNGLDIFAGVASAHQTGLPNSFSLTSVLQPVGGSNGPPTLPNSTHVRWGLTLGVGFDLSVFTQIFGKTSSPSLP